VVLKFLCTFQKNIMKNYLVSDEALRDIELHFEGNLHIYARELTSGRIWALREHELLSTASTIKLPILIHAALCVHEGSLSWDQPVVLRSADKVAGMGVLRHLHDDLRLTLRDACYLMTAISDNTATNLVLDITGIENVNRRMHDFGLSRTRVNRKAFSPDTEQSRRFGLGETTVFEMTQLMNLLYSPEHFDTEYAQKAAPQLPGPALSVIREMLSLQQDLVGIARVLPPDWSYAGKTGRINSLRADVARIVAPDAREWHMSIFCFGLETVNWSIENDGLLATAAASRHILGFHT
jgi:beta-lactamase class A